MSAIQETFKNFLREMIAPRLRQAGLKGSGQNYSLKSGSHWALISFQKSAYSDSENLKFTINIFVVAKEEWESARNEYSYFPAKPTASVHWSIGWHQRIGYLLPINSDYWWTLDENTNLNQLSQQIIDVICNRAIPIMLDKTTTRKV